MLTIPQDPVQAFIADVNTAYPQSVAAAKGSLITAMRPFLANRTITAQQKLDAVGQQAAVLMLTQRNTVQAMLTPLGQAHPASAFYITDPDGSKKQLVLSEDGTSVSVVAVTA